MMEADMVSETLGFYPQLTRLVARDFIEFSRRESFKSYIIIKLNKLHGTGTESILGS
jgi:hypothetical protein